MGDVIRLDEHRRVREMPVKRPVRTRAEFYFDLSCPFSYLAAERVERAFTRVTWRPASASVIERRDLVADPLSTERIRRIAEARAEELHVPLQWPDRFPAEVPAAMRAASYACDQGRGSEFLLAAGRLAFCGGFDLDDPEILAEAAAAAGINLARCLRAAGDLRRDGAIEAASRGLLAAGADRLPALRIGRSLVWGEDRVASALAATRVGTAAVR